MVIDWNPIESPFTRKRFDLLETGDKTNVPYGTIWRLDYDLFAGRHYCLDSDIGPQLRHLV